MAKTAVFRADAAIRIGGGHVHRCLTLADALRNRGWKIGFACIPEALNVVPALRQTELKLLILTGSQSEELAAMRTHWPDGVDLLVVDHYERDAEYEHAAKPWARRVAALDDVPSRRHEADLLLDQTAGRVAQDYRCLVGDEAIVLTGSEYVLLRPDIKAVPVPARRTPRRAKRAFVCFGATDPDDVTRRALAALGTSGLADLDATVVVGQNYAWRNEIMIAPPGNARIYVDPPELPRLMSEADVALAGSGTTAWELAYFGVPALLAQNSPGSVVSSLVAAGAARPLGIVDDITATSIADALSSLVPDAAGRASMSAAGRRMIDGRGAQRVLETLERHI